MDEEVKLMNKVLHEQKYNALAKIAEGSYGQIFLVENKVSGQKFVLKALQIQKLKKQSRMHEAFMQSLILGKLKHPGVIRVYETIERENYFSQILDYCPNGDVFKLMARVNHDLCLVKKKKQIMHFYLSQILEAISYLHSKNVIHRDLKPENIVVDQNLHIKLIDFGTALITDDEFLSQAEKETFSYLKKQDKQLVGSAHYLSPQTLKFNYSQKSDIWAFGVIAYKFYHNSLPFVGANNFQIIQKIKQTEPYISESIPLSIKQVIQACLRKDCSERPNAQMLKNYAFFKGVKFSSIFDTMPPIQAQQVKTNNSSTFGGLGSSKNLGSSKKIQNQQLFSVVLQKKMFFGNYKPRILALFTKRGILYFAYKYVDTKLTKNQVQLNMNDYCQKTSNNQFQIKSEDKHYVFKCQPTQNIQEIVEQINLTIKQHFML